jgi:hypothetical protein
VISIEIGKEITVNKPKPMSPQEVIARHLFEESEIDLFVDREIERIGRMSDEEVNRELCALGITPRSSQESVKEIQFPLIILFFLLASVTQRKVVSACAALALLAGGSIYAVTCVNNQNPETPNRQIPSDYTSAQPHSGAGFKDAEKKPDLPQRAASRSQGFPRKAISSKAPLDQAAPIHVPVTTLQTDPVTSRSRPYHHQPIIDSALR